MNFQPIFWAGCLAGGAAAALVILILSMIIGDSCA